MDIKELTHEQLVSWLKEHGIASYRAGQIFKWIYLRQVDRFEDMTDLGKDIRPMLASHFTIDRLEKCREEVSQLDGSRKFLFRLADGHYIESVLIPEKDHYTLCISSQAGCAQNCRFCLTAQGGFHRNLTAGEIIAQVRDAVTEVGPDDPRRLTNLVFMGMGEPLANYTHLVNALKIITDGDFGLKLSTRRVTVSTCGLVPMLRRMGEDTIVNLAISLNATDNKTRDMLMPVNRRYPLEELLAACREYSLKPRQRITFEYILIQGINDSPEDAKRLAKLLQGIRSKVNLIPFNEHEGSEFRRPDEAAILKFQEILMKHDYTVVIRRSKGQDISAACGQLQASALSEEKS